ncbi:hypothetical protein JQ634_14675 [Bradyrhizobium sp. AUGA SZCCT0240]|uniref:hypothetical protein n=1 Tax=Bradyrhizobium sp. AUGA SZCCT0240 TaxID=2807669 RepID=UPI001BA99AA2|nr:hypothetical protein [Bradyrhizobium sp. AUGA SZCCT0240]MBR1254943.1 hypothetical protein [Bradyrhizobium sp. AUGA SZCCT0240]
MICHDARFKTYRVSSHTCRPGARSLTSSADPAQRYQVLPNQIGAWKKHLLEHAARAFEGGSGDAGAGHAREVEKPPAKVGWFIMERVSCEEVRKMSNPESRALGHGERSVRGGAGSRNRPAQASIGCDLPRTMMTSRRCCSGYELCTT